MSDYLEKGNTQPPKQLSYNLYQPNPTKPGERTEIIETSQGNVFGIKYKDANGDLSNYEEVSIYTYSKKGNELVKNNDEKKLSFVSDLTREYQIFGEEKSLIKNEPCALLKDKEGFSSEIKDKALVEHLSKRLADEPNNTSIKPANKGFVNGNNNSKFIAPDGEKLIIMEKPAVFQPDPKDKNKIEEMPPETKSSGQLYFFRE